MRNKHSCWKASMIASKKGSCLSADSSTLPRLFSARCLLFSLTAQAANQLVPRSAALVSTRTLATQSSNHPMRPATRAERFPRGFGGRRPLQGSSHVAVPAATHKTQRLVRQIIYRERQPLFVVAIHSAATELAHSPLVPGQQLPKEDR